MVAATRLRRPPVAFAVIAVMVLPVLLVAAVLWRGFSAQIQDSYDKRLITSLNIFELVISEGVEEFRGTLSRLAADNTLRMTVNLDIRPQLKRYLQSQFEISELRFVRVLNQSGEEITTVSRIDGTISPCRMSSQQAAETLMTQGSNLLLVRSLPLIHKDRPLGHVCAGFALDGDTISDVVQPRIDGLAIIAWKDREFILNNEMQIALLPSDDGKWIDSAAAQDAPPGSQAQGLLASTDVYRPFDATGLTVHQADKHFHGLAKRVRIAGEPINLGVLVDMKEYESVQEQALLIIAFVVAAVLIITGFGLRMFGLRRHAEQQLFIEREKAVVTLASIADGVVTTDRDGKINYINPAAEELLGEKGPDLYGNHLYDAFELKSESTGERLLDIERLASGHTAIDFEDAVLTARTGTRTAVNFAVAPIQRGSLLSGAVITFRDVHHERELRRRLAWKASRDDLTGLLNRSEFRRSLSAIIDESRGNDDHHCLLYIDLDEFKVVNDTCGHRAGDELLRQVSASLVGLLRQSDTVARLGGDEFGVLLRHCSRDRGVELAEQIIEIINDKRFQYRDRVFHVGASIGMVSMSDDTDNIEDLLSTVDAACYAAKENGRNRVFVGEVDAAKILHRMDELSQASNIRQAIKADRLVLYRQSIVSTSNPNPGSEVHAEVLVRMRDESGKLVPPGAFIPIAERYGLMQEIDRWVVRHLFQVEGARLRAWRPANLADGVDRDFVYSINLSGASLMDPTFLDFVREELLRYAIPGGAVAFEITETQIITHLDKAVEFITALKNLGCRFLLDDFGSGMSSFGYLKHLPVDYLKIDGLFVKDILTDPIDRAMVKMINEIGHTMGLITIAEYVENEAILNQITKIGVNMAQGFGISKPEPLNPTEPKLKMVEA